jgi:hypothetical protein
MQAHLAAVGVDAKPKTSKAAAKPKQDISEFV